MAKLSRSLGLLTPAEVLAANRRRLAHPYQRAEIRSADESSRVG